MNPLYTPPQNNILVRPVRRYPYLGQEQRNIMNVRRRLDFRTFEEKFHELTQLLISGTDQNVFYILNSSKNSSDYKYNNNKLSLGYFFFDKRKDVSNILDMVNEENILLPVGSKIFFNGDIIKPLYYSEEVSYNKRLITFPLIIIMKIVLLIKKGFKIKELNDFIIEYFSNKEDSDKIIKIFESNDLIVSSINTAKSAIKFVDENNIVNFNDYNEKFKIFAELMKIAFLKNPKKL